MNHIKTSSERIRELNGFCHPVDVFLAEIAELREALGRTCSSCKHWERYKPAPKNSMAAQILDYTNRGKCTGVPLDLVDCPGEGGFHPMEDFGCNMFED